MKLILIFFFVIIIFSIFSLALLFKWEKLGIFILSNISISFIYTFILYLLKFNNGLGFFFLTLTFFAIHTILIFIFSIFKFIHLRNSEKQLKQNWKLFLLANVTLGLAPFNPPHIVGKIKWILGGNAFSGKDAMQFQDWFDVLLHGSPWVLLAVSVILNLSSKLVKTDSE